MSLKTFKTKNKGKKIVQSSIFRCLKKSLFSSALKDRHLFRGYFGKSF